LDVGESPNHETVGRFDLAEVGSVNDFLAQLKQRLRESRVGQQARVLPANQHGDHLRKADVEHYQLIGGDLIEEVIDKRRSRFGDVTLRQRAAVQEKQPHERRSSRNAISSRLKALSSALVPHSSWIRARKRSTPTGSPWTPQVAINSFH